MSTSAAQFRAFILAQLAAESYLDRVQTGTPTTLQRRLRLGSNHYSVVGDTEPASRLPDLLGKSRMTEVQIAEFSTQFRIVDHRSNTQSGFSATLMQRMVDEYGNPIDGGVEYTLSFRSTEYADDDAGGDWTGDGPFGATNEIAER